MFYIGPHRIGSRVLLAPMAGVSDAPFRRICQQMGAGLTTSEMLTADTRLWHSRKSSLRLMDDLPATSQSNLPARSIQIVGGDPDAMAEAARHAVDQGAELVDINMGCPAKKVCNKAAGSALLQDEQLVADILRAVVAAVEVPVTLKIRTGWCPATRNGVAIAKIAEDIGIQALAVHGRTRACRFNGEAEYHTIAEIAAAVDIPVVANGDIDSPAKAAEVLAQTGAQAVMIGRAAQGQPWLLSQIHHFLETGQSTSAPALEAITRLISDHLTALYDFYGEYLGPRIARKHVKWYLQKLAPRLRPDHVEDQTQEPSEAIEDFLRRFNAINSPDQQHASVQQAFERLINKEDIAA